MEDTCGNYGVDETHNAIVESGDCHLTSPDSREIMCVKINNKWGRRWLTTGFVKNEKDTKKIQKVLISSDDEEVKEDMCVVYIPSLGGAMWSLPAVAIQCACRKLGLSFLRYDGTHLGASVLMTKPHGNILTLWLDDARQLIHHYVPNSRLMLVAFSLGATIAIKLAEEWPERVMGLILVSPVVNLHLVGPRIGNLAYLYFLSLTLRTRASFKLLQDFKKDLKKHKVKSRKAAVKIECPIRIIQGMKDTFPYINAVRIANLVAQEDVEVELVKDGDHLMKCNVGLKGIVAKLTELAMRV